MTQTRPVIGILTYGRRDVAVDNFHYDDYYSSPAFYTDAVRRAGGLPVQLAPGEPNIADWLDLVDGFIFTGGTDIAPQHYNGEVNHPQQLQPSAERDATELALLQLVRAEGSIPALFICRGMQLLNVGIGGDLHQHIPDIQATDIHRDDKGCWTVQPVAVDSGSKLAKVMETTQVATYSGHHQAVRTVAADLSVVATAPDGIIEALEDPKHPYFIGVQWHPEVSAHQDASQQKLFNGLVQAARLYKAGA
nr:gamma-glutamyl-gamma-aminobutyrate hydrolase family protein [Amylibacter sp.]